MCHAQRLILYFIAHNPVTTLYHSNCYIVYENIFSLCSCFCCPLSVASRQPIIISGSDRDFFGVFSLLKILLIFELAPEQDFYNNKIYIYTICHNKIKLKKHTRTIFVYADAREACSYIIIHNGLVNFVVKSYLSNLIIYWFLELFRFLLWERRI